MKKTRLLNLTPHELTVHNSPITCVAIAPEGIVARVETQNIEAMPINSIPCVRTVYGAVTGLPEPEDGVIFIVSGMVLSALAGSGRDDVVAPGELVRDDAGRPIGCLGLRRL